MPTVLRKHGFRFHFFSADGHEPPHIHVNKDGSRAKIWLATLEVAKKGDFSERDIVAILDIVADHRNEMLEAWYEFFQ